jgi:hypothetical protein
MNVKTDLLARSILNKETLDQCSVQELKQLAGKYPFFGPVQYLLAKKLQGHNQEQYLEQIQKASLVFQNTLWLQQLLNETGEAEITEAAQAFEINDPLPEPEKPMLIVEEIQVPVKDLQNEVTPEPIIETPPLEIVSSEIPDEKVEQTPEPVGEIEATIIPEENEPEPLMEIPRLKIEPLDPAKTDLVFEPYHTVDYFASQGIRVKDEEKPTDKFGQQLRSFTEWLKTLKRLPVSEATQHIGVNAEQKVEQLADQSIKDREVITEAMAEVWEKQGNAQKAIEVYTKLSLLEPSKSLYFATKIDALKKTI